MDRRSEVHLNRFQFAERKKFLPIYHFTVDATRMKTERRRQKFFVCTEGKYFDVPSQ